MIPSWLLRSCCFMLVFSFSYQPALAAAPLTKVVMTTGSVSEREGAVYVAHERGFFRKYGVDVSFVQVRNGPVGMAALSSGETQLHWGSVSGANLGAIAEGAELVFVAGFINRLTGMFVASPKISSPMELKGKSIGVNSLSGGGWIFTMLTLDYWGLVPERDKIQFRSLGDQSVMVQGFMAGTVDAVLGIRARQEFREQGIPRSSRCRKIAHSVSRNRPDIAPILYGLIARDCGECAQRTYRCGGFHS